MFSAFFFLFSNHDRPSEMVCVIMLRSSYVTCRVESLTIESTSCSYHRFWWFRVSSAINKQTVANDQWLNSFSCWFFFSVDKWLSTSCWNEKLIVIHSFRYHLIFYDCLRRGSSFCGSCYPQHCWWFWRVADSYNWGLSTCKINWSLTNKAQLKLDLTTRAMNKREQKLIVEDFLACRLVVVSCTKRWSVQNIRGADKIGQSIKAAQGTGILSQSPPLPHIMSSTLHSHSLGKI